MTGRTGHAALILAALWALTAPATAGLIGWWTLDGNLTDSSATGLDATPTVSASYGSGQFGQAAACYDATDASYNVADSAVWDTGSAVTVSHWFKTTSSDSGKALVVHDWGPGSTEYKYLTYITGGGSTLAFYVRTTDSSSAKSVTYGGTWNDGGWHHIVGVYDRYASDGDRIKLYIDGIERAAAPGANADITAGNQGITFGRWNTTDTVYTGWLDDVAIFDQPLTATQVSALYAGTETPGTVLLAESGSAVAEPAGLALLGLLGLSASNGALVCIRRRRS